MFFQNQGGQAPPGGRRDQGGERRAAGLFRVGAHQQGQAGRAEAAGEGVAGQRRHAVGAGLAVGGVVQGQRGEVVTPGYNLARPAFGVGQDGFDLVHGGPFRPGAPGAQRLQFVTLCPVRR